jgi:aminopeptidase N
MDLYKANNAKASYSYDVKSVGRRALKNTALYYLCADETAKNSPHGPELLAWAQCCTADNMTDRSAGLRALLRMDHKSSYSALEMDIYYQDFLKDSTPLDTWFGMNVTYAGKDAVKAAAHIVQHPDFQNASPNRIRAVIGGVAAAPEAFHNKDGSGYNYIAQEIIKLDSQNPQTAARFVDVLADFRKYQDPWQGLMKTALVSVASQPKLSTDVDAKLKKILGNDYPVKATGPSAPTPTGP